MLSPSATLRSNISLDIFRCLWAFSSLSFPANSPLFMTSDYFPQNSVQAALLPEAISHSCQAVFSAATSAFHLSREHSTSMLNCGCLCGVCVCVCVCVCLSPPLDDVSLPFDSLQDSSPEPDLKTSGWLNGYVLVMCKNQDPDCILSWWVTVGQWKPRKGKC